ncbi:hypothetical protein EMQ25_16890 [Arsenicitalea aurantiaca]|uniref:4-oxalocrotonate tautomerase-like domain-containing protein n=1 Tax=Arsenicitalea aurantiaca TaxID=1783274 RepID=A0A433X2E1_9HYPH|nr:hypothetical protein EMQ25_16890 [Arsenicitalea aurantiaca]
MPYVHIDWVAGQSPEKRDDVAKRVSTAVSEVTGLGLGDIWVVFKEIDAERNRQHRRGLCRARGSRRDAGVRQYRH